MKFPAHARREHRQAASEMPPNKTMYRVTDRLHRERTVRVPGNQIALVVAAWLAELDVHNPLVDDLARAACVGDWAAAYAVGDQLSVDVSPVAAA